MISDLILCQALGITSAWITKDTMVFARLLGYVRRSRPSSLVGVRRLPPANNNCWQGVEGSHTSMNPHGETCQLP